MASDDAVGGSNVVAFRQIPPLYAERKEAAVSMLVNLAKEAKLASEGVKAPGQAVLTVCKSLQSLDSKIQLYWDSVLKAQHG